MPVGLFVESGFGSLEGVLGSGELLAGVLLAASVREGEPCGDDSIRC